MTDAARTLLSSLSELPKTSRLPVLFVGHGSPMNAIEDTPHTRAWEKVGRELPRPAAILAVSAHWLSSGTTVVDVSDAPKTIYDFYGFPRSLYDLAYPVPGAPLLARGTKEILAPKAQMNEHVYGIDHGAWVPLLRMFPMADIPVFQLSIDYPKSGVHHLDLGTLLAPLRERGVLIVASGNIVHNLSTMRMDGTTYDWAEEFDAKVKALIEKGDARGLADYTTLGTSAVYAVPTPDHYWPLLYAVGAATGGAPSFPTEGIDLGSVSMRSVLWT